MPSFRAPSFMGGGKPGIKPPSFVSKAPPSKTTTPTVSSPVPDLAPAPAPDQVTDSHVQALAKYMGYGPVSPETQTHRDLKEVLRRMSEEDKGVPIMDLIASAGKARVEELLDSVRNDPERLEKSKEFMGSESELTPEEFGLDPEDRAGLMLPGEEAEEAKQDMKRKRLDPDDVRSEPRSEDRWGDIPKTYDPADEGESERLKRFQGSSEKVTKVSNWVGSNCAFAKSAALRHDEVTAELSIEEIQRTLRALVNIRDTTQSDNERHYADGYIVQMDKDLSGMAEDAKRYLKSVNAQAGRPAPWDYFAGREKPPAEAGSVDRQ